MISAETIALVRERTDLVALIGESVKLVRRGRSFVGLCPFHKEKTPSFHVSPERGMFHCFGCKESGSAIDFVMKTDGLKFPDAVRALAERCGIAVEETLTDAERREAAAARRSKEELYAVSHLAATFFERCLGDPPAVAAAMRHAGGRSSGHPLAHHAWRELEQRGLLVPASPGAERAPGVDPVADALQAFRVGYAPWGWDGLATFLKQHGISPLVAERVGLLVPRSSGSGYYDRFRHRLMFAIVDVMGRVVGFSGRVLPDPSPDEVAALGIAGPSPAAPGDAPAKYINSPESPIYTKGETLFGLYQARQSIRQSGEAILVEGNFDVVSLHARGVTNVVAPLGTAFTTAQGKLLKRFAPAVVLLFDSDAAGKKATRAARAPCREAGLVARVATLPPGMDPDEVARTRGPEAIAQAVRSARGLLEHLLDDALEGDAFRGAGLTEQLARIRAVATLLAEEEDPSLRLMAKTYADRLSSKLLVQGRAPADVRDLERMLERALAGTERKRAPGDAAPPAAGPPRKPDAAERIGLEVLGALLDYTELLDDPDVDGALSVLEGDAALAVAALRQARTPEKGIYAAEFLALIPPAIHPFAAGRLASPVFEALLVAKTVLLENARKLKRLSLSRETAAVTDELHRVEARGDAASEDALLREVERRTRQKHGLS